MIYSKIKLALIATLFFAGCSSKYDYTIHKPKVRYKPSLSALDKLNSSNMGKRYVWAEEGPYCFDCSGFTYFTYGTMGIEIPRVAREQFKKGTPIPRSELQKGDLVFFDTSRSRRGVPTHVGIYVGNGMFEHASTAKKRVVISSLNKPYYRSRYLGARRYYNFNNYNNYPKFQPQLAQKSISNQPSYSPTTSYSKESLKSSYTNTIAANSNSSYDEGVY
jgi:hypothetical protein